MKTFRCIDHNIEDDEVKDATVSGVSLSFFR